MGGKSSFTRESIYYCTLEAVERFKTTTLPPLLSSAVFVVLAESKDAIRVTT